MMNENFESYSIEDEESYSTENKESCSTEDKEESQQPRRLTMWSIVPHIMITPAQGWETVKECGPMPEIATIRFLLPLCLLTGFSVFFSALYPQYNSFSSDESAFTVLLVNGVVQFCAFFIGYYLALVMAKLFLPKDVRTLPSSRYGRLLIMTGVASLAFFHVVYEAFPMLDFILVFLPLWTIFILFKGMERAEERSEKHILAIAVVCLVTIAGPTITEWVLALFI